jgi:hypothetical protein
VLYPKTLELPSLFLTIAFRNVFEVPINARLPKAPLILIAWMKDLWLYWPRIDKPDFDAEIEVMIPGKFSDE